MKILFIFFACLSIIDCASSPTGRKQLMLLPDSQMDAMGRQSFEEMKKQTPIERDPKINAYVKCIATTVAKEAGGELDAANLEIVVFNDKQVNAFALPGGKIGVYKGILPVAKTAPQLAAVLGHEMGHVIARHGNERVSEGLIAQGVMVGASILEQNNPNRDLFLGLLGVGAQVGYLLPHSRTQESEADVIGQKLMAKAGFNPEESIALWRNMAAAAGGQPPQFLSTHPSHESRIAGLESRMPEALGFYKDAQAHGKIPNCGSL